MNDTILWPADEIEETRRRYIVASYNCRITWWTPPPSTYRQIDR